VACFSPVKNQFYKRKNRHRGGFLKNFGLAFVQLCAYRFSTAIGLE